MPEPIKGQSHWCDGRKKDGYPCSNFVSNDKDRCAAGHPNKIRRSAAKAPRKSSEIGGVW